MKKILLLTCVIIGSALYAQEPNTISLELAKSAAIQHAKMTYEDVSFFAVTPYYDIDGNITVYCIALKKNTGRDYSETYLINELERSYVELKSLKSELESTQTLELGSEKIEENHCKNILQGKE